MSRLALVLLLFACNLFQYAWSGQGLNGKKLRNDNDGHPLCNGGHSNGPLLMCWAPKGGVKRYNCMWYTMEVLSGWPGTPRTPGLSCDDIEIDCESSFVCTVLLEYRGVGPMPHFGEDSDRAIAAACLITQCPKQAREAEAVVDGRLGATCPHTHNQAQVSTSSHAVPILKPTTISSISMVVGMNSIGSSTTTTEFGGSRISSDLSGSSNSSALDGSMSSLEGSKVSSAVDKRKNPPALEGNTSLNGSNKNKFFPPNNNGVLAMSNFWPGLIFVGLIFLGVSAVYSRLRPHEVNSARDVLLPAMEARDDPIMELEAVQETDRIQIATNDAE